MVPMVMAGWLTQGQATAAVLLVMRLEVHVFNILFFAGEIQHSVTSLGRAVALATLEDAASTGAKQKGKNAKHKDTPRLTHAPTITIKNLSYNYPGGAPVLRDVSFTATPGTTTALIGATGSGKTTALSLIPRLYLPTEGHVLLDGTDVAEMKRGDVVKRVGLVPQKPYLFSGSVASNLRLGAPEASDEELWAALRTAQADFVEDLDMHIAQGGTNVSGGQRQRLSIARMLVARPLVYLFDDSFSALDVVTDAAVRDAMREYTAEATTIIVAQRVSSIVDADQILVMDAGRIVARGTHEELLDSSETYREIVESQKTAEVA